MECPDRSKIRAAAGSQTVYWVIAVLLAAIAAGLWTRPEGGLLRVAAAQSQVPAGARGIFAFTGPLDRDQYGLFMLDVDQGTIWCYAFDMVNGVRKLRLIAGRTFMYDRYLQDFNCATPDFRMVQKLVSQQRNQTGTEPLPAAEAQPERSPQDTKPPGG